MQNYKQNKSLNVPKSSHHELLVLTKSKNFSLESPSCSMDYNYLAGRKIHMRLRMRWFEQYPIKNGITVSVRKGEENQ